MSQLRDEHFDAVVVGSGFGGSVVTYRLAEAGLHVCLLERGKSFKAGSFPRSPRSIMENFWDPSEGRHGLFNVWSFRGLEALISSGLGGGSLIYANVLLRMNRNWMVNDDPGSGTQSPWPLPYEHLEEHYDRVERVLQPKRLPSGLPYEVVRKTAEFQRAAASLGLDWERVNLAVTFGLPGMGPAPGVPFGGNDNLHHTFRSTCRLCGECDVGCNFGSKNTMDYTFLSRAIDRTIHRAAVIRPRCEVRRFEPIDRGGFAVHYVDHEREGNDKGRHVRTSTLPLTRITTRRLVLSAGTLGTTFLLLKNRSAFPRISPTLGTRFCGNGDLLGFIDDARELRDGRWRPRLLEPGSGPVITSAVKVQDALDGGTGRGFYIQDGGYPEFVSWVLKTQPFPRTLFRLARFAERRVLARLTGDPQSDISGEVGALLGRHPSSSALPVLGMGRDVPDGRMRLRGGYLDVDWTTRTSKEYFDRLRGTMRDLAGQLGGRFRENPLGRLNRVITVHPLGGCPMGRHSGEGVVDARGEVFNYRGMFIADGSVMPGPTGANPSLTIAAMADHFADHIIESYW